MMGLHVYLPPWLPFSHLFLLTWQLTSRKQGSISYVLGSHQRLDQHSPLGKCFLASGCFCLGPGHLDHWDKQIRHPPWCWPFSVTHERPMCDNLTQFNSVVMDPALLSSFPLPLFTLLYLLGGWGRKQVLLCSSAWALQPPLPKCWGYRKASATSWLFPALIFLLWGGLSLQNSGLSGPMTELVIPEFAEQIIKASFLMFSQFPKITRIFTQVMNSLYLAK